MKFLKASLLKFDKLKLSRKISAICSIIMIIVIQITSIVVIININSFITVFSKIQIPNGYVYINMNIYEPENMNITIPYQIQNTGVSDLTNINMNVEIYINYINDTNKLDITKIVYQKYHFLGNCRAFCNKSGTLQGHSESFIIPNVITFFDYFDATKPVFFLMNLTIKANYFLNLIQFANTIRNQTI